MPVIDLFSKRQKRARGEMPDVFMYEVLPHPLRVQIVFLLRDALGLPRPEEWFTRSRNAYDTIYSTLCREYGQLSLLPRDDEDRYVALAAYMMSTPDYERVLDVVEVAFHQIEILGRDYAFVREVEPTLQPDEAIVELNARLLEHGVGYQFESGRIIRIDSTLLHQEVVRPALQLLAAKEYSGVEEEYLSAHKHYREGDYSTCLVDCLKSLESTLKVICEKRHWPYEQTNGAKTLIAICFDNGLVPKYLESHFSALRCSLESGIPTVRNKEAGHGKGTKMVTVPQFMAEYLLHLTATSILFLVDAEEALPRVPKR